MTQAQKMKRALERLVAAQLLSEGFCGTFPHYRKVYPDRIELISFPKYKYGNAFHVIASVAFPLEEREKQNVAWAVFDGGFDDLTADDCVERYVVKGNFQDCFYYTDVYRTQLLGGAIYLGVSEERAKQYVPKRSHKLVQKADEGIYERICHDVNAKMKQVCRWWAKMSKRRDQ